MTNYRKFCSRTTLFVTTGLVLTGVSLAGCGNGEDATPVPAVSANVTIQPGPSPTPVVFANPEAKKRAEFMEKNDN